MKLYAIVRCPSCNYLQIVELQNYHHIHKIRTKCRKCKKSFKLIYKNKPSWSGNLAVLSLFTSIIEAREKLKEMKISSSFYNGEVKGSFDGCIEGFRE